MHAAPNEPAAPAPAPTAPASSRDSRPPRDSRPFAIAPLRATLAKLAPGCALVAASFAFRAPALLNARDTNSDAAVVGLQAMHLLRGEWSAFLWGSGYQTSVDSFAAAAAFAVGGASPLALMLSSFALHLVLTLLAFDVARRHTSPWMAALLAAPLVLTSSPSATYILYPPRQAALTLGMASMWLLDRGAARASWRSLAMGGAVASLACFADPYALVLVPPLAIFALACAWRGRDRAGTARSLGACAAGAALGIVPALVLWSSPRASHGQVGLTAGVVAHNAQLLIDACLPWAIGGKTYYARHAMDYGPWELPLPLRALQMTAGMSLLVAMIAGGALSLSRRLAPGVRRLGLAGGVALPVTLGGFLTSVMVMDIFSARYLAAIVLFAPFALAPLAARLGLTRFALAIAPALAASAVAGWVGYGPYVDGALPVRVTRGVSDEERLASSLAARGVRYATADYWASYRITFVTRESLIVVPTNRVEDRYPPYRAAFEAARRVAYIFDPLRSREAPGSFAERMAAEGTYARVHERFEVGGLSVLVLDRADGATHAP